MTSEVKSLKGLENEPNKDVIHRLEVWLCAAKKGEILAVAMVADIVGNLTRHAVEGPVNFPNTVYCLESLKFKLLRLMEDQEEDLTE